jgi:hypothetical protein
MKLSLFPAIAATVFSLASLQATPAAAQRVFVAAQGSDANPCTFAAPCRTFQHAHDTVAAGGEIDVLDPAGYGALTISKAISIQGHGFSGISVASGGTGITIAAGSSDAISLNGLLIEGGGVGSHGIQFDAGKSLVVENCAVGNFPLGTGLLFQPGGATPATLSISDSYFTDSDVGVTMAPLGSGTLAASISRVAFYNNAQNGFLVDGSGATGLVNVAVTDSVAGNGGPGFNVGSAVSHATTNLVLTRSTASGNTIGVSSFGTNATMRLSQSTVTGNGTGFLAINSGVMLSYGDNYIAGNGSNNGSLGSAIKQ